MKKDIEWLKENIGELPNTDAVFISDGKQYVGTGVPVLPVYDLIDQLYEPEVNSQIDKLANFIMSEVEGEPSRSQGAVDTAIRIIKYYQNQETLSQELPEIPKFVADWIEETKPYNSLIVAFEYIAERKRGNHDDELAFWIGEDNSETFARAWLDGYEVEEEQKYYVLNASGSAILRRNPDKEYASTIAYAESGRLMKHIVAQEEEHLYQFTEQEIKDYDGRFWPFAVKVEELKE